MKNLISRSLIAAILAALVTTGSNAQFKYSPDLSVTAELGLHQRYFGTIFGATSQDDPGLQGWITIADKKSGVYVSEWQNRDARNTNTTNFNYENDHSLGIARPINESLSVDTNVTYFDCVSQSTDWWASDTTLTYTRGEWQPFVRAMYLVPTNNTETEGGLFYKVGVKGSALGLSITPSLGGHGNALGYSGKLSFAQLIVTKSIPVTKDTSISFSALAQKKISRGPDSVETRWPPTFSASITRTFN